MPSNLFEAVSSVIGHRRVTVLAGGEERKNSAAMKKASAGIHFLVYVMTQMYWEDKIGTESISDRTSCHHRP
jgi:hypothetical protein